MPSRAPKTPRRQSNTRKTSRPFVASEIPIDLNKLDHLYFDKPINNVFETYPNIDEINTLSEELDYYGQKIGLSALRPIFKDFNPTLQKEQMALTLTSQANFTTTTRDNCATTDTRKREYEKNWKNMCFYCGTSLDSGQDKQCDHVIDIISMFAIIKPCKTEFYKNFQFVHKECNNKASNNNLTWIWDKIGDPKHFPAPPTRDERVKAEQEKRVWEGPPAGDARYIVTNALVDIYPGVVPDHLKENFFKYNSAVCRYYLFENILQRLTPWPQNQFENKINIIQKVYTHYKMFLEKANALFMEVPEDIGAAHELHALQHHTQQKIDEPSRLTKGITKQKNQKNQKTQKKKKKKN